MTPAQREEYFKTVLLDKSFEISGKINGIEPSVLNIEIRIVSHYLHELNMIQESFYSDFKYDESLYDQVSNFKKGDMVTCIGNLKHLSYYSSCDFDLTGINIYSVPTYNKVKKSNFKKISQLFRNSIDHLKII